MIQYLIAIYAGNPKHQAFHNEWFQEIRLLNPESVLIELDRNSEATFCNLLLEKLDWSQSVLILLDNSDSESYELGAVNGLLRKMVSLKATIHLLIHHPNGMGKEWLQYFKNAENTEE
jgi:hypothetical protein